VLNNNRVLLARAITLIESNSQKHRESAKKLLSALLPKAGNSLRIGITGVPGAGKSTLIETLGLYLIKQGLKVAVLTIDPTSEISGGSILGDKTRMEKLSREKNCFVRPSPTGGALGGVARKTRETITVLEAAGYDVILIETVGVGQSETEARSMTDFFLLVLIPGAGDELQGIKKGIMELIDCILINKAEGENKTLAEKAKRNYENALSLLRPATKGWRPKVLTGSALYSEGIEQLWAIIKQFEKETKAEGFFQERRQKQAIDWLKKLIEEGLLELFYSDEKTVTKYNELKQRILKSEILPTAAAEELLATFKQRL
jgi:LAO/AO transport system kinase